VALPRVPIHEDPLTMSPSLKTLLRSSGTFSVHIQQPKNVAAHCAEQARAAPDEWVQAALRLNPSGPLSEAIRALGMIR
jgi:Leu/Phe-tRNA-protein transferase